MTPDQAHSLRLGRLQWIALLVGLIGTGLSVVGALTDRTQFFQSYLTGFLYWWLATVGCLGLAVIYQMTGGRWGYAARPFFDAGAGTLPLMTLAFVPLALGLPAIYAWTEPSYFEGNPHAANRQWYLSESFFIGRAIGYFAVCWIVALLVSARFPRHGRPPSQTWPILGGVGAVLLLLVVTFAAIDWGMSLEPEWYSTMYGGIFAVGALVVAMGLCAAAVALASLCLARTGEIATTIVHDLGKLLLAFLMVWAYTEFSQYIIVYSGDLPVEAVWYTKRLAGGWQWIALAMVLVHFVFPFLALLSAQLKRNYRQMAAIALGLAAVHVLKVYWTIVPGMEHPRLFLHWLDVTVWAGIGGLWLFVFVWQLRYRLVPILAHWPYPEWEQG